MEFQILQENFSKLLKIAAAVAPGKALTPVLTNTLISADLESGRIGVAATDLYTSVRTWCGGKITESGAVILPAQFLANLIGTFPSSPINVKLNPEKLIAEISVDHIYTPVGGVEADEFPTLPNMNDALALLTIRFGDLKALINRVAFCRKTKDEGRPMITGVLLRLSTDQALAVAIDGARMGVQAMPLAIGVDESIDLIIPGNSLALMSNIFDEDDQVTIRSAGSHMMICTDNLEFSTRLFDGEFVPFERMIPTSPAAAVEVDRLTLTAIAKSALAFGDTINDHLEIIVSSDLVFQTKQYEDRRYRNRIPAANHTVLQPFPEGVAPWIRVVIKNFAEALAVLQTPTVILELRGPDKVLLIREPGNEQGIYTMMPIRVDGGAAPKAI